MRKTLTHAVLAAMTVLAATATTSAFGTAGGNPWPSRPVKLVVSSAAGSGTDIFARLIGERLSRALGQPFIIDNRPGANGILGNEYAARASPDGYTLLFTYAATMAINPGLFPKLAYDPRKDFVPVAQVGSVGNMLLVTPDLPIHNLRELVAYAKAHPGQIDFGSWGTGSGGHLTMESVMHQTGIKMRHIPYKSVPQMTNDMLGGNIKVAFADVTSPIQLIKAGKLRAIAVSGTTRVPQFPDVPTLVEQGVPFRTASWYGAFAPAGTPPAIVARLNREVNAALASPEIRARMTELNLPLAPQTQPTEFGQRLAADITTWGSIIQAANVKAE